MFIDFLKFLWSFIRKKPIYGVSIEDSIVISELPRLYPKINTEFKVNSQSPTYRVISVDDKEETVVIKRTDDAKIFELNIDLFEEFFVPTDPNYNYPL